MEKYQSSNVPIAQPEKATRPVICSKLSAEDWEYSMYRWRFYKRATHMKEHDAVTELIKTCSEQLQQDYQWRYQNHKFIAS